MATEEKEGLNPQSDDSSKFTWEIEENLGFKPLQISRNLEEKEDIMYKDRLYLVDNAREDINIIPTLGGSDSFQIDWTTVSQKNVESIHNFELK